MTRSRSIRSLSVCAVAATLAVGATTATPSTAQAAPDFFKDPGKNKAAVFDAADAVKKVFAGLEILDELIVGSGPSLADLLENAKIEIISTITTQRDERLNGIATGDLRNYKEIVLDGNPDSRAYRIAEWFNDTNRTIGEMEVIMESGALESARDLSAIYNLLVAARAKALQEEGKVKAVLDDFLNNAMRANHRLVGANQVRRSTGPCFFGSCLPGPWYYTTMYSSRMWEMASDDWFDAGKLTPRLSSGVLYGGYCPCQVWTMTCGTDTLKCNRSFDNELNLQKSDIEQDFNSDGKVSIIRAALANLVRLGYTTVGNDRVITQVWPGY